MFVQTLTKDTEIAMALAKEKHWGFRIVGNDSKITSPEFKDMWFIPTNENDFTIPKEAMDRIHAMKERGIKIKYLWVAHEKPLDLPAEQKPTPKISIDWGDVFSTIASVFVVAGGILLSLFEVLTFIDPFLIAILEDGTAIEVYEWFK